MSQRNLLPYTLSICIEWKSGGVSLLSRLLCRLVLTVVNVAEMEWQQLGQQQNQILHHLIVLSLQQKKKKWKRVLQHSHPMKLKTNLNNTIISNNEKSQKTEMRWAVGNNNNKQISFWSEWIWIAVLDVHIELKECWAQYFAINRKAHLLIHFWFFRFRNCRKLDQGWNARHAK